MNERRMLDDHGDRTTATNAAAMNDDAKDGATDDATDGATNGATTSGAWRNVIAFTVSAAVFGAGSVAAGAVGLGPLASRPQEGHLEVTGTNGQDHALQDHVLNDGATIDGHATATSNADRHDHAAPAGPHGHGDQVGQAGQGGHGSPADARTHGAAMAFVDPEVATHTAVASGSWSSGSTWSAGSVPSAGSRVVIPTGVTVTVDGQVADAPKTIGVAGTLRFAHDVDTELRVDTIVTHPGSRFEIGTPDQPIHADVVARVVFTDDGTIDRDWDPSLLSRGALLHGTTVVQGSTKTHRAIVATHPRAGDQVVELTTEPSGWRVGDALVVSGTNGPTSD
ncbi:MAG: G8 domain-containing protein, partial [Actinomycetota bacterium]